MENLDIITPPEIKSTGKHGGFWKQLGMLVLDGTKLCGCQHPKNQSRQPYDILKRLTP